MIELRDVSIGYGHRAVLSNVNMEASRGMLLGLVGPNGSGKSTLIRGMSRVIKLFSGSILFDGRDITTIRRDELARLLATVSQTPTLPEAFTCFELVLMGRTPHLGLLRYEGSRDLSIAFQAMEATETRYLADRRVGEISGGEKQRLIVARALTQQPGAILLDEPTSHLDIRHQLDILNLVRSLCLDQNLIVVAALHDLNLAAQFCDRIVMLSEGRVFAEGSPESVLTAQNIREVYGADVHVYPHPVNRLPTTLITAEASANAELSYTEH